MKYTNSPLVSYTRISPHKSKDRNHEIDTITIHCYVGQVTAKQGCDYFATTPRKCSSNYVLGKDGSVGLSVEEKDRAFTSSSKSNDNRAVTIEVASDKVDPYRITDSAYKGLIELLVDICKRNNIPKLLWRADKSLIGQVDKQNITVHRWFASTECPGDYIYENLGKIASEVNTRLQSSTVTESTETSSDSIDYKSIEVGDILNFKGTSQYNSASSSTPINASASKVKVTQVYTKTSKHPIHVRAVNEAGEFTKGVYGWVDLKDLSTIEPSSFRVKITTEALNYRQGPGMDYDIVGTIRDHGVYTIIEEKNGWGKLASKVGWISLNSKYSKKI